MILLSIDSYLDYLFVSEDVKLIAIADLSPYLYENCSFLAHLPLKVSNLEISLDWS